MLKRLALSGLLLLALLPAGIVAAPSVAFAEGTTKINSTAFPLSGNVLFPARSQRQTLRCYNPTTNAAATITYNSGFAFVLQPGGSVWETGGRTPTGIISATGTAAQPAPPLDELAEK